MHPCTVWKMMCRPSVPALGREVMRVGRCAVGDGACESASTRMRLSRPDACDGPGNHR